jgi:hypothetical protein
MFGFLIAVAATALFIAALVVKMLFWPDRHLPGE